MNDFHRIPKLKTFYDIFNIEIEKVRAVFEKHPDVMVTHFIPSISAVAFHAKYRNDANNAFYSFQFDTEMMKCAKDSTWIYGHTHDTHEFQIGNVKCLTNPFGYPRENPGHKVKTIEI